MQEKKKGDAIISLLFASMDAKELRDYFLLSSLLSKLGHVYLRLSPPKQIVMAI